MLFPCAPRARAILIAGAVLAAGAPASAQLYAIDVNGSLWSVNTSNAALTLIGNTGIPAPGPGSLEYNAADGMLYSMSIGGAATLFRINPANASTTTIGPAGAFIFEGGLQFSPGGTLYGTNRGSATDARLFTVNITTGATTEVGSMGTAENDVNGLGWRSDGTLVGLHRPTSSLVLINPVTAAVSHLAFAPESVGNTGGMATLGNQGFFSPETDNLYSFNAFTGVALLIGPMQADIKGLALVPAPAGAGVLVLVGVAALRRRR